MNNTPTHTMGCKINQIRRQGRKCTCGASLKLCKHGYATRGGKCNPKVCG